MINKKKGSALLVVAIVGAVTALLAGSVVALISSQRRIGLRKELQLHAINTAEGAADYAYSILINKITTTANFAITEIPATGSSALTLPTPATSFLAGNITLPPSSYSGPTGTVTLSNGAVRVQPASALNTTVENRRYIDPADPANDNDVNRGQWVWERTIPLVSRATASQIDQSQTAYVRKNLVVRQVPMFQHAIFFQGQLQLHRGYRVVGPVHTNSILMLNAHDGDTSYYAGALSSASQFFRGSTVDNGGYGVDPFGYTPIDINGNLDFATSSINVAATGNNRISIYKETQTTNGVPSYISAYSNGGLDSRTAGWKNTVLSTFKGNLQDVSHAVPTYTPQGSVKYRQDVASTTTTNEFSNGTYSLIEPLLPVGHPSRKSDVANRNKLAGRAGLLLRVERNASYTAADAAAMALMPGGLYANEWRAVNRNQRFVVKAYKSTWPTGQPDPTLTPVPLPSQVIGVASTAIDAVSNGIPHPELYTTTGTGNNDNDITVTAGLHDARMGRGVEPFTLDMGRLKAVIEGTATDATAVAFRAAFSTTGTNPDWNGVVYFELPTSLTPNILAPANTTQAAGHSVTTLPFTYGQAEVRHPDRWAETDNYGRVDRDDNIVPIAKELRKYPATSALLSSNYVTAIKSAEFAIPAVQIIDARSLPNPAGSAGFTFATNGPVYIIGSYNSDANTATGTNLTSNSPTAYATSDANEIPAAIFCDTLTLLSDTWPTNRPHSFKGTNGDASTRVANARIEVAACIATGEYPVFEFFTHALESFQSLYGSGPPIVIKGSVIGMFKSEIQHIKQAYGRNVNVQIEDYWSDHGAYAIPSVRYHQNLVNGNFPPGIPNAFIFRQSDYLLLRPGIAADQAIISAAGF